MWWCMLLIVITISCACPLWPFDIQQLYSYSALVARGNGEAVVGPYCNLVEPCQHIQLMVLACISVFSSYKEVFYKLILAPK